MKRNETYRVADASKPPRKRKGTFNQVFDEDGKRVRGLWLRNGVYYAQVRFSPTQTNRMHLQDAKTIPQAIAARQELRRKIDRGEIKPPGAEGQKPTEEIKQAGPQPVGSHTLKEAIEGYQADRDALEEKDKATAAREDSGLKKWIEFGGGTELNGVDSKFLKDFAKWRKEQAAEALEKQKKGARTVGGRTLDLNKLALDHVFDWAVTEKWLLAKPALEWKKKAKAPKEIRLIPESELHALCSANLTALEPETIATLPKRWRHLQVQYAGTAQAFSDYLRLIFLTGGREAETIAQQWPNVDWERKVIHFPGQTAKAGGGEPADPRDIPFYDKLEAHLKVMWERRDPSNDWMFPSIRNPKKHTNSFRKQLTHAKQLTKIRDVGFHHGKHFFISGCVMRGVDFKTIALWASHRDGGMLVATKYGHLSPGHSESQAAKLNGGASLLPTQPPSRSRSPRSAHTPPGS